jgi:hypothetical protein
MMIMSMELDYVSELPPPTGLLFIRQVIYEHGYPWWNDIGKGHCNSSTRTLWQSYQLSHLVAKQRKLGELGLGLTKYLRSYIERFFNMP